MPGNYRKFVARWNKAVPQASYLKQLTAILWSPAKGYTIAWLAVLLVAAMLPVVSILLSKTVVDSLVAAMKVGMTPEAARHLLLVGGLLASIAVLIDFLNGLSEWVRTAQTELIQDHVSELIQNKSVTVDYAFYESSEYYDRLYRARDDAKSRIPSLLENFGSVFQNCVTLVALCTIIAMYNGFLLLALGLSLIPAFFVIARFNWLTHEWWKETTPQRRWLAYYDLKFSNPASAAEIRLLKLGPRFQSAYRVLRTQLRVAHLRLITRQTVTRGAAAIGGVIVAGLPVGWMAWKAMRGQATFGDMIVFYQAFLGGQGFVRMVTLSMAQVYSGSLYLTNLCEFLALESTIKDPLLPAQRPADLHSCIEFRNVTFRYPGSERIALANLDLTIPAGKVVAIVGPNGAGKSTLVKLLSRFYDPAEGCITIDGISLCDYSLKDIRSFFSILFQTPVNYDATAAENISMGDIDAAPHVARIKEAARRAGAEEVISKLPQEYETFLGKSFATGVELSAGEWQRVSMARAFFREAPVILLDEPTSYMDPWSEADWFERARDLARNRTAVIITHRFTIARRADLIHVMEAGRVVESGTHSELLENNCLYAQSWREQVAAGDGYVPDRHSVAASASR